MDKKKIAIILPGMGYKMDKPLLYYSSKIVQGMGYELIFVEYHDLPEKTRGDVSKAKSAADIAYEQTEEQLAGVEFSEYEDVLFIGKSIGTIIAAKYVHEHDTDARQIWYTPLEATFKFDSKNAIAFFGEADQWSDLNSVKKIAEEQGVKLWTYPECNHSLESPDIIKNIEYMKDVMSLSKEFIERRR